MTIQVHHLRSTRLWGRAGEDGRDLTVGGRTSKGDPECQNLKKRSRPKRVLVGLGRELKSYD